MGLQFQVWIRNGSPSTSMVRFVLSPEIRERVLEYNKIKRTTECMDAESPSIEHLQLVEIASTLQVDGPEKPDCSLASLLKSTSLYLEPKPVPKPVLPLRSFLTAEPGIPSTNEQSSETARGAGIQHSRLVHQTHSQSIALLRRGLYLNRRKISQESSVGNHQYTIIHGIRVCRDIRVDEKLAGLPCTSKDDELMISEFYGVCSLQQLSEQARQDYTCSTGGTWNKTNPPKPSAQDKNETK